MPSSPERRVEFVISVEDFARATEQNLNTKDLVDLAKQMLSDFINKKQKPTDSYQKEQLELTRKELQNKKLEKSIDVDGEIKREKLRQIRARNKRIDKIESLKERKLEAETELLERQIAYGDTFGKTPTPTAQKAMKRGVEHKFFGTQTGVGYDVDIQTKKNFFIDKQTDGSYIGCCRICKTFATDVCTTSKEAEHDIESHLYIVHQQELYQR